MLSSVALKVLTKSGREMVDALIDGERARAVLAAMAKAACVQARRAHPGALAGRFEEHHALLLGVHLAHIDQLDTHIAMIDARVDELFGPFAERRDRLTTIPGVGSPPRSSSPRSASTCPCSPPPDTSHSGLGCYANFESAGKQ